MSRLRERKRTLLYLAAEAGCLVWEARLATMEGGDARALIGASVRMFVLTAGKDLRGEEMAQMFIDNISRMERMLRKQPAPFIANVYRSEVKLMYPPPPPSPPSNEGLFLPV